MQWLIDLMTEWAEAQGYATQAWVNAQGFLPPAFVDRGDPVNHDFAVGDFTTDATWRELDLSAIVPAGAKSILVRFSINDNQVDSRATFRRHGNVNTAATSWMITQNANIYNTLPMVISIDEDRKIDYWFSNRVWTAIYFTVIGWWL